MLLDDHPDQEPDVGGEVGVLLQDVPVALAERALPDQLLHVGGELEQADRLGDGRLTHLHGQGDLALAHACAIGERLVALGLLDRVQVGALQVLHQSDFEGGTVVDIQDTDGKGPNPDRQRGPVAPLSADDLVLVAEAGGRRDGADHQRLEQAVGHDALAQLLQIPRAGTSSAG